MTSLHELGAVPLGRLVRTGQASCREIVCAFLDRIDALNPRYNAVVSLRPREDILREAEAADARVAAGEPLGPLHGLPMAVKDLSPTAGLRTTFGSPIFAGLYPRDGFAPGGAAEGGGRGDHRQDQHAGIWLGVAHL